MTPKEHASFDHEAVTLVGKDDAILTYSVYQSIMAEIESGIMRAVLSSGTDCTALILTKVKAIGDRTYNTVKYDGNPDDRTMRFIRMVYEQLHQYFKELSPEIADRFREFAGETPARS